MEVGKILMTTKDLRRLEGVREVIGEPVPKPPVGAWRCVRPAAPCVPPRLHDGRTIFYRAYTPLRPYGSEQTGASR